MDTMQQMVCHIFFHLDSLALQIFGNCQGKTKYSGWQKWDWLLFFNIISSPWNNASDGDSVLSSSTSQVFHSGQQNSVKFTPRIWFSPCGALLAQFILGMDLGLFVLISFFSIIVIYNIYVVSITSLLNNSILDYQRNCQERLTFIDVAHEHFIPCHSLVSFGKINV